MTPILYITRNGMLEPLGQSQVLAYLRGLSQDYSITLISFEKPEDAADKAAMERVRADCAAHGIRWLPQRFHYRPRILAPAWSMLVFLWLCLREVRRGNAQLIHARSYIPAAVALVVNRLTGTPFIFDMRALWPEELITAGRLRRGSPMHRALVRAERACLRRATAVVSLTEAAVGYLRQTYPGELAGQRIAVIPTCADLDRFRPDPRGTRDGGPALYGCIGTVLSGWFRLDWLAAFLHAAAERDPKACFEIVTRDNEAEVRAAIGGDRAFQARLCVYPMPPERVHEAVQKQTASAMFYAGGEISELGRSPTRMAEILGCGLPVVANAGVGDVAGIISSYRVGILVTEGTKAAMSEALAELDILRADPQLPARCRQAAEEVFSLEQGTAAYRILYADILGAAAPSQPRGTVS